jgi:hypothetical protein
MKKIPLEFRKKEYDLKLQSYEQKNNLRKLIGKEISQLLGIDPSDDFEYFNTVKCFFSLLEQQKKEVNSLGLVGEKLAELLQINITKLKELQSEYIKVQFAVLPSIEEFTRYAITESQITKHNDLITLTKSIHTIKPHLEDLGAYNHTKIVRAFLPMLSFDDSTQKIVPNNEFILS